MQTTRTPTRVQRRHVLYVSGFDPRGAKQAHSLYKSESAHQHKQSGGPSVEVGRRVKDTAGNATWTLDADLPDGPVRGRMTFLGWDDIVRAHWPQDTLRLWIDSLRTTAFNLRHGVLQRMLRASYPPVVALVTPMLLVTLVVLALLLLGALGMAATHWLGLHWGVVAGGLLVGLAVMVAGARALVLRFSMYWVARSYAFNARLAQGMVPEWQPKVQAHARALVDAVAALANEPDAQACEVLLVGHSSGSILAVSILAEALRIDPALARRGPAVSLLTLGQCIPMLGCFPQADGLRQDLALLGTAEGIAWLDFSAPPDGCCFALCDPLWACGVPLQAPRLPDRPKLLSPRFAEMFDASAYAELRADRLKLHFQYLMSSQHPVDYDYFHITAGSQTLAERFAALASVNDYTQLRMPRR